MLSKGLCRVTGFEPQEQPLFELQRRKGPNERYLPYAVGDGGTYTLNICKASGMSSLFDPDPTTLKLFGILSQLGEVTRQVPLETRKLDDISEIEHLDFLKIDIQGGELKVFQGGAAKLAGCRNPNRSLFRDAVQRSTSSGISIWKCVAKHTFRTVLPQ
jgi:FkbM family methyltransferase